MAAPVLRAIPRKSAIVALVSSRSRRCAARTQFTATHSPRLTWSIHRRTSSRRSTTAWNSNASPSAAATRPSRAPVTQAVSWGAKPEPGGNGAGAVWERSRTVKRAHEEDAGEEYGAPVVRAKRTRMGRDGDEVWFHRSIAGTVQAAGSGDREEADEEKVFLVPSAVAFPQVMSEEFSKSPSNSPASSRGTDRMDAYFAEALALRVLRMWPHVFDVALPRELTDGAIAEDDDATALRVLNAVTPIPRFLHFTLNERVLRAFDGHDRVHVIDFDIKQGLQWSGLLQSLATRAVPPAHVRITGVGESRQELQETGARLGRAAAVLGLAFEFHAVVDRLKDVRQWILHVKRGECVAVNCVLAAHRLLRDETGVTIADFLGLVRSTGAAILLLGEHEDALNSGRWEARFARARCGGD